MKINSLEKLLVHELKDLYSAEKQILSHLDKVIDKTTNGELKTALSEHRNLTRTHVQRLESIFSGLDHEPGGHRCKGMEGLLKEGDDLLKDTTDSATRDAGIIAAAQRVEHYEMAGYGTARTYARMLEKDDVAETLQKTLDEEADADEKLTRIAEHVVNPKAISA
ncbi:MAG TPA: ferritin-like domain-containing protein [Longimicrobiales bacterium]|nr:ferritin-like domain-containing protein [Longimicrobiales bacterium]